MSARIVVSFHGQAGPSAESTPGYLERALSLVKRADVHGGSLAAWSADALALVFPEDALEEALDFCVAAAREDHGPDKRWSVGVAQGELSPVLPTQEGAGLSWGEALVRAERLARLARPGEVLLHQALPALDAGELLTTGRRIGQLGSGAVVRGLVLDLALPRRRDALAKIGRLVVAPPFLGREEELAKLDVPLGCAGLLRAARGSGGTRLLRELELRLSPSRVLAIEPGFSPHEPLGALRNALGRSSSQVEPPGLPDELISAFDKLVAGDGITIELAAELISAWLAPEEHRFGLLVVDDAALVDASTLEAVALAILPDGFVRAVVRISADEPLPAALASIPISSEVTLGPLPPPAAEALARAFCAGAATDEAARRWARRGGGEPLAIREAIATGIATGALAWTGDVAEPRGRTSGQGKPAGARVFLAERMAWLLAGERAAMLALALLGGDAPVELVDAVATLMEGPLARLAVVEEGLVSQGWVVVPEPGWLAFTSRSLAEALLSSVEEATLELFHRVVARTLEQQVGPLGLAEPAYHAVRSGDATFGASLAAQASYAALAAGLRSAAALLAAEAKGLDPSVSVPYFAAERAPSEGKPDQGKPKDEGGQTEGLSILSMIESTMEEGGAGPASQAQGGERDDDGDVDRGEGLSFHPAKPSVAEAMAALGDDPEANEDPDVMGVRLSRLTKQALVEGDLETLEHLLVRLRVTGEHDALVERMGAFIALGRDAHGDALRKLRAAAEAETSPGARARARLSYAIALASVGDVHSALLETLDALGRAREAKDPRGERATAKFLAYLAAAMGQPQAASVWVKVAQLSGEAIRG